MNHYSALLNVTLAIFCCMLAPPIITNFTTYNIEMDPSEEKKEKKPTAPRKRSYFLPAVLLIILLGSIGGIYAFLNSSSTPPLILPDNITEETEPAPESSSVTNDRETIKSSDIQEETLVDVLEDAIETDTTMTDEDEVTVTAEIEQEAKSVETTPETITTLASPEDMAPKGITTICSEPAEQLDAFYRHLDKQAYIQAYRLQDKSEVHFEKLIAKLLDNPPKVTRESDDLYTILRNTAHFFRISGKDNILMLKGILNSEKDSLEQILADYYFLISTPECVHNKYAKNINGDALYEYACFFLNTMGGRLYLFRRDSESRMVVTYYAILLVDQANRQQNNRHGIALKPAINMLISEMEIGGSKMKGSEDYLDILYDLKEEYQ